MDRSITLVDYAYFKERCLSVCSEVGISFYKQVDYAELTKLVAESSHEITGLPHLRTYWYDAKEDTESWSESDTNSIYRQYANIVKYGTIRNRQGTRRRDAEPVQKRVDAMIVSDLIRFAQLNTVCDLVLLSGDEDLIPGVEEAQERGVKVSLLGVEGHDQTVSLDLLSIVDAFSYILKEGILACCRPETE